MQRSLRVVFVCDRGSEHREDTVPRRLHDVALVVVYRIDHQLECGIDDRTRFLGIEMLLEFSRAPDVGRQHSDSFALAFEVLAPPCRYGGERRLSGRWLDRQQWLGALEAEFGGGRIFTAARRAPPSKCRRALNAEFRPIRIFGPAFRAAHAECPSSRQTPTNGRDVIRCAGLGESLSERPVPHPNSDDLISI